MLIGSQQAGLWSVSSEGHFFRVEHRCMPAWLFPPPSARALGDFSTDIPKDLVEKSQECPQDEVL